MDIFVAAFFCVLNICLWVTFFMKFKKIFSTDDIIASTKEQMDNMIADINRNAGRNIELIEDRIKTLKSLVAEADRHVELAKRELENQKARLADQQQTDSVPQAKRSVRPPASAANQYLRNQNISAGLQSGNRYALTDEGSRHVHQPPLQQDLFEQAASEDARRIVSDAGTTFTVESDGSSYASVPVIGDSVAYADEFDQPQKKFGELVHDLHSAGHSVDEIARELNSSTTEVQLVLDMDF